MLLAAIDRWGVRGALERSNAMLALAVWRHLAGRSSNSMAGMHGMHGGAAESFARAGGDPFGPLLGSNLLTKWQLDSIALRRELRGRGIGRALIEAGLASARADGTGAFLSTGTPANVTIYRRCGFRVYAETDAPGPVSVYRRIFAAAPAPSTCDTLYVPSRTRWPLRISKS